MIDVKTRINKEIKTEYYRYLRIREAANLLLISRKPPGTTILQISNLSMQTQVVRKAT